MLYLEANVKFGNLSFFISNKNHDLCFEMFATKISGYGDLTQGLYSYYFLYIFTVY